MNSQVRVSGINSELPTILILVMVVAFFAGTYANGFTWHDRPLIQETSALSLSDVPGFFRDLQPSPDNDGTFQYRPMSRTSLLIDHVLLSNMPYRIRIENVLFHFLAVFLFYHIVLKAFGDIRTAMFSSMLFAIHPLAVEPVNSVMAREGTICVMFIMLSLFALQRAGTKSLRWGLLALCSFALSVFSLEAAIMLCVFLLLMFFISKGEFIRPGASGIVAFLLAAAAYFALRVMLHGGETLTEFLSPVLWDSGVPGELLSGFYGYVTMLTFPLSLGVGYSHGPVAISSFQGIVALSSLAILVAFAVFPLSSRALRSSCIWIIVFFIPFSNYVPYASLGLSDRYVYLALPGVCLLLGWIISELTVRNRYFGSLLLAGILVVLGVTTHRQNIVWTNDFTLWENAVERSPSSAYANYNLGRVHDEIDSRPNAVAYYDKALELDPLYAAPYFGLGNLYRKDEKFELAVKNLKLALLLSPEKTWINLNIGDVFMDMSEWDKAVESYSRYLRQYPDNPEAHHKLAVAFEEKGDYTSAMEHFNEALSAWPGNAKARYNFSRLLLKINDTGNASHELKLALLIKPDYSEARKLLNEISGTDRK